MDWGDMKIPSWDLSELEHDTEPNIGVTASSSGGGGSGGIGHRKIETDCSVDLKLGGLGDFGCSSSSRWKDHLKIPTLAVSTNHPGPSRRSRAQNNGSQKVSCLVDGCKSDLSNCRDYHRRHKVCEAHSKTPVVFVAGQEQRFCQQCSRFHQLVEFDEVKRSCRKRLDGHNKRRRKPQPEALRTGSLLPNLQVPQFSSYSHMFPATVPDPMWGGSVVKEEDNILYRFHQPPLHFNLNRQHSFPPPESSSYARSYPEGKSFPFLQDHDAAAAGVGGERSLGLQTSCCQPLINTISFSGSNSNSNGSKFFSSHRHHQQQHQQQSRGLTQVRDSDCALSLLSSPTQTPSVDHHHIPVGQPLAQSLQQQFRGLISYPPRSQSSNNVSTTGFSCSGMENEHVVSNVLVSGATNDVTDLQCSGTFHPPSSSALPFSWPQ